MLDTSCLSAGTRVIVENLSHYFEGTLVCGETADEFLEIDMNGRFTILDDDSGEILRINGWMFDCYVG